MFKDFKIHKIISKKISDLKITSDDISLIYGKLKCKSLVKIKLTYFNKLPRRTLIICFENGNQIYVDLLKSTLKIFGKEKIKLIRFKKSSQYSTTKEMYVNIFNKNYINICSYVDGLDLLKSIKLKK